MTTPTLSAIPDASANHPQTPPSAQPRKQALSDLSDDSEIEYVGTVTPDEPKPATAKNRLWYNSSTDKSPIKMDKGKEKKVREDTPFPHIDPQMPALVPLPEKVAFAGKVASPEREFEALRPRRAAAMNHKYIPTPASVPSPATRQVDGNIAKMLANHPAAEHVAGMRLPAKSQACGTLKRKSDADQNKENVPPPKKARSTPSNVDITVDNNCDDGEKAAAYFDMAPGEVGAEVEIYGTKSGTVRVVHSATHATVTCADAHDDKIDVTVAKPPRKRIVSKGTKEAAEYDDDEKDTDADDEFTAEELKEMGALDYSKRVSRSSNSSSQLGNHFRPATDDVRTVFVHVVVDGKKLYRCVLCWNGGKKRKANTEYSMDSPSSLRRHIKVTPGHFEHYEKECKKKGIQMHPRSIPATHDPKNLVQIPLVFPQNGPLKRQPLTPEGILKHIAAFVISDDQAYLMANHRTFRQLIVYSSSGTIADADIPHRTTVSREVNRQYVVACERLVAKLKTVPSQISFTCDGGTTHTKEPVLAITGHWIAGTPSNPNDWQVHQQCLAFKVIPGRHNAEVFSKMLFNTFKSLGILKKIGWSMSDNAEVNDKMIRLLGGKMKEEIDRDWPAKSRRGRCSEHSLNITARHIATTTAPTAFSRIKDAAGEGGGGDATEEEELPELVDIGIEDDVDQVASGDESDSDDNLFKGVNSESTSDDATNVDSAEITDAHLSNGVGKALATITQINRSPITRHFLEKQMVEVGLKPLRLHGYVPTRFASLFDCLSRFLHFKEALKRFYLLADEADCVPPLAKKRLYSSFRLSNSQWEILALLTDVLHPIAQACSSFSSDSRPALYRILPVVEFIMETLEAQAADPKYKLLHPAIEAGLASLRKTYRQMDDTELHVMSMVLNPTMKLAYIESRWDKSFLAQARKTLEKVFDEYASKDPSPSPSALSSASTSFSELSSTTVSTSGSKPIANRADNNYGMAWIEAAVQKKLSATASMSGLRAELERYLRVGPDPTVTDIVAWWGSHQLDYPILSRMARDYLAVPGSSSASERLFSAEGLIVGIRRCSLSPRTLERHQVLRSSYKVGDLTTTSN